MARGLAFLLLLISCRSPSIPPITFQEDFENPGFRENWDWIDTCGPNSIIRTDSVARAGRYALRIELNHDDSTEAGLNTTVLEKYALDRDTSQYWWGFSNYLPADFAVDSVLDVFAYWYPKNEACELSVLSPVILDVVRNSWQLKISWSAKSMCDPQFRPENIQTKEFDLGPWEKSIWSDWLFHIHFSYQEDGYVQVWKNGKLLLDYRGPCLYKDADFVNFKIGIMKWTWNNRWRDSVEQSVIRHRHYFIDNIRIGNRKASIADFSLKGQDLPK